MPNVVLFGFMGTGKTAVGKEVARRLQMQFVDMDDVIEEKEGCSISDIFAEKGESYFRRLEADVAEKLSREEGQVIATGGGVVLNRESVDALQSSGVGICLMASPEVIFQRIKGEAHRPLLLGRDPLEKISILLERREPFYRRIANRIDTSRLSLEQVVEEVVCIVGKGSSREPH